MAPVRKAQKRPRLVTFNVKVGSLKGPSKVRKVPITIRNSIGRKTNKTIESADVGPATILGACAPRGDDTVVDRNDEDINTSSLEKRTSSYRRRLNNEESGWRNLRESLRKVYIQEQFLPDDINCMECQERTTKPKKAVCRCRDCSWQHYLCLECATSIHSKRGIFHVLEIWKDGTFQPLFLNSFVLTPPGHMECQSIHNMKDIVFVDVKGCQHLKKISLCKCQTEAEALVSMGFWPGSAERPTIAFDMRLLDLFSKLLFECQASLDKLCATLDVLKNPLLPSYIKNIYRILNASSFDEFRLFRHSVGIQIDKCVLCPMPGESGTLIEIMDACFGFVRKRSAGSSLNDPRFETKMFGDQDDVDNFVTMHSKQVQKSDNECSHYRAGEITDGIRSKGRNEKFDEKAVFGRICRHGHPKGFINLKHGERIAYAVYELKRMVEPYKDSEDIEIKCMYDIACILDTHLQNNEKYNLGDILAKVDFGIPIFHAYVHKARCQVKYSPRRAEGFGLTDGEGIERLWSYLRKFSCMTKEMRPSKRIDILSEALIHYSKRMFKNHGRNSAKKVHQLKKKTHADLAQLVLSVPGLTLKDITDDLMNEWKEEELKIVTKRSDVPIVAGQTWKIKYADLIWKHFLARNSLATFDIESEDGNDKHSLLKSKLQSQEEKLKSVEKKRCIKQRWKITDSSFLTAMKTAEVAKYDSFLEALYNMAVERHLQLMLKERYSRGQKLAIRLARLCNKQTKQMKAEISKFNTGLSILKEHVDIPLKRVSFDDAKDLKSSLYQPILNNQVISKDPIPFSTKKRVIELKELLLRCSEEEVLLKSECGRLFAWLKAFLNNSQVESEVLSEKEDKHSKGLSATIKSQYLAMAKYTAENRATFEKFGIEIPGFIIEYKCQHMSSELHREYNDCSSDDECSSLCSDSEFFDSDSDSDIESIQ